MGVTTVVLPIEPISWSSVIDELQKAGLSQEKIGNECDCSQPHISALRTGHQHEPKFSVGVRLLRLRDKLRNTATRRTIR